MLRQVSVLDTHRIARPPKGLPDYHCRKGDQIAKDCRTKAYELAKTSDPPQKESKPVVCFNCRQEEHIVQQKGRTRLRK